MSFEAQLIERYASARERLFNSPPPPPKPPRTRPYRPDSLVMIREQQRMKIRAQREAFESQMWKDERVAPVDATEPPALTIREIADQVAQKHGVTVLEMRSVRRAAHLVDARYEAFWRCYRETDKSLPQIGAAFGGRDHTTVMHGIRKHEKMLEGQG